MWILTEKYLLYSLLNFFSHIDFWNGHFFVLMRILYLNSYQYKIYLSNYKSFFAKLISCCKKWVNPGF